jgi:hypothetical protein
MNLALGAVIVSILALGVWSAIQPAHRPTLGLGCEAAQTPWPSPMPSGWSSPEPCSS